MRVLLTGSRDWSDEQVLKDVVAIFGPSDVLLSGACLTGADAMAEKHWPGVVERHPADWKAHGKRAGFVRNQEMVESQPHLCLAFVGPCRKHPVQPPHDSHGASMTVKLCRDAGIEVREYRPAARPAEGG